MDNGREYRKCGTLCDLAGKWIPSLGTDFRPRASGIHSAHRGKALSDGKRYLT